MRLQLRLHLRETVVRVLLQEARRPGLRLRLELRRVRLDLLLERLQLRLHLREAVVRILGGVQLLKQARRAGLRLRSNFAVSALIFSWSAFSFASTFAKPSSGFSDVCTKLDGAAFASCSNFAVSALIFSWSAFSFASTFANP